MIESKRLVPKFKNIQVEDGFREISVYITKDGREFQHKFEAESHEENLDLKEKCSKLKHIEVLDIPNLSEDVYYIESEEDIRTICNMFHVNRCSCGFSDANGDNIDIKFHAYYFVIFEDGGDYSSDSLEFILASSVKERLQKVTDKLP